MKPIVQTILDPKKGNCFDACLASIFETDITEFDTAEHGSNWFMRAVDLAGRFGYTLMMVQVNDKEPLSWLDSYYIASGYTERYDGKVLHAVVYRKGELVHDPHPSGVGIKKMMDVTLLVPVAEKKI